MASPLEKEFTALYHRTDRSAMLAWLDQHPGLPFFVAPGTIITFVIEVDDLETLQLMLRATPFESVLFFIALQYRSLRVLTWLLTQRWVIDHQIEFAFELTNREGHGETLKLLYQHLTVEQRSN